MNLHPSHPAYCFPPKLQRYIVATTDWVRKRPFEALYCAGWTGALAAAILLAALSPDCPPRIQFPPATTKSGSAQK